MDGSVHVKSNWYFSFRSKNHDICEKKQTHPYLLETKLTLTEKV